MGVLIIDTISKNKSVFNPDPGLSSAKYGIWDLTKSSVYYSSTPIFDDVFIVTEYYQMRPDLIAAIKYGDHSKVGSLLKYNNISNPFALMEGTVLAMPSYKSIEDPFTQRKNKNQSNPISNTNSNPNEVFKKTQEQKQFKVSDGRKKFLDSKIKNHPVMILSPNITQPNETTILKKDGFLIFAPDAGGGGFNKPI
jgi:hypothetical protein